MVKYNSTIAAYTGPITELSERYASIDFLKTKLDRHRPLDPIAVESLHNDMILRYTYHSNAIEGNTLTLSETKVILENGITIGGRTLREHLEVINHRDAINYLESIVNDYSFLSERIIKELHSLILKSIDTQNAGRYRRQNVYISGAGFTPPDFLQVPDHMERLIAWCSAEHTRKLHPVERAARLHADFVNIHPFIDGNGRTARLLMNLELLKAGYPVVIVPVEERPSYYDNLDAIAVNGKFTPFIKQICVLAEASLNKILNLLPTDKLKRKSRMR
jgi:Fic family protein